MAEHQLVDYSVFDRSGYLIGKVARVEPLVEGNFSLILQLIGEGLINREATIGNGDIKAIDSEKNILHLDRDHQEFIPQSGQGIQLLEERLVVHRKRHKIGEISVRKVVETDMISVPIRREKLVVERIGEVDPLVEIGLGSTRVEGSGLGNNSEMAAGAPELTTSGSLRTIRETVNFLESVDQLSDHHCKKVRVAISLQQGSGLEATAHQFESPHTAIRVLSALEQVLLEQCNQVRLELLLKDEAMLHTYQTWFAQAT
jgi:hypothetical protein